MPSSVTLQKSQFLSVAFTLWPVLVLACTVVGCGSDSPDVAGDAGSMPQAPAFACEIKQGTKSVPDSLPRLGCRADFDALSSEPLDTSIPGARSLKVVLDLQDDDALYFQNSVKYELHYTFASAKLSGGDLPYVPTKSEFDDTEYESPDRRFVLGIVTYYEGSKTFALELESWDRATPAMIDKLFSLVKDATYFGKTLKFHATSPTIEASLDELGTDIATITDDKLFAGIDYQPLNLATGVGRLRFVNAAELAGMYLSFSDLVVLDEVPNDITVVAGMITQQFQTPLSHVNVLAQNRGTPNMGLREAMTNKELRALDGKWVSLTVGPSKWTITEVTSEEAQAFLDAHGPKARTLPPVDTSVTDLRDIEEVVVQEEGQSLRDAIVASLPAFGGKAAHYSVMSNEPSIPMPKAFAIPTGYYVQFMEDNGFYDQVDAWLADPNFLDDPAIRDARLLELRDAMMLGTVDEGFQTLLMAKLEEYPDTRIRFRTSTNSEDLEGFPCAGCYESHTGDRSDWNDVLDAIRESYASIWLFRTFEERAYYKVDHQSVAMALLVHHSFPEEEANGVAVTANRFDPSGLQPAFYINVQYGGMYEVVHPPPGVTSDQFLYSYQMTGQPSKYLAHSNVLPAGQATVLNNRQIHELGVALETIHKLFSKAYGPASGNNGWYAMDVEFKFDGTTQEDATLQIKQARPFPDPFQGQ